MIPTDLRGYNFTAYKNPKINEIIGSQVQEISELILSQYRDTVSLSLLGGYARGEGSVIFTENELVPLGDYDFLLVTNYPHRNIQFSELELLRKKFRVQYHIEVGKVWKARLPLFDKQIFWYEVKYGSKLVYGRDVFDLVPMHASSDIELREGFRLMFNRLESMTRYFDFSFLNEEPNNDEKEHLIFQSVKAILACGESLLLLNSKYHFSYLKRYENLKGSFKQDFQELILGDPDFEEDFEKATFFKLRPNFDMFEDSVGLWFRAKRHLLVTLLFFLWKHDKSFRGSFPEFSFEDFPEQYMSISRPKLIDYLFFNFQAMRGYGSSKGFLQLRHSFSDVMRLSMYHLALSISQSGVVDSAHLDRAIEIIKRIFPISISSNGIRDECTRWKATQFLISRSWYLTIQ